MPPMSQGNSALEDGRFTAFLTQPRLRLCPVRASCVYPQLSLSTFCEHKQVEPSPQLNTITGTLTDLEYSNRVENVFVEVSFFTSSFSYSSFSE